MDAPVLNELPNKEVRALEMDNDGYLWIGTTRGLFRYTGNSYVSYRQETKGGLSSDDIRSIHCDSSGRLWVGTDYGINMIEGTSVVMTSPRNYNLVSAVCDYDREYLFYSGYNAIGLIRKEDGAFDRLVVSEKLSEARKAVLVDDGDILVLDKNAENVYILDHDSFSVKGSLKGDGNGPISDFIPLEGGLLVCTTTGVIPEGTVGDGVRSIAEFLKGRHVLFAQAEDDVLYFGVSDLGVVMAELQSGRCTVLDGDTLPGLSWGISEVGRNHVFFSPEGYGIASLSCSAKKTYEIPFNSRKDLITKLFRTSDGNMLGITFRSALLFDSKGGTVTDITPWEPGENMMTLFCPGDHLLVSLRDRLTHYVLEDGRLLVRGSVRAPSLTGLFFSDGEYRFISGGRLFRWDGYGEPLDGGAEVRTSLMDSFRTASGKVLLTDFHDLYRYEDWGLVKIPVEIPFPISADEDSNGTLWVASGSDGLYRYDPVTGELEHYSTAEWLPDDSVSQVEVDGDDNVWVCMRNSVMRIDGTDSHRTLFRNTNPEATSFAGASSVKTVGGKVFFSGRRSVQELTYDEETEHGNIPLRIEAVSVNGQTVPPERDMMRLPSEENSVVFHFTALSYDTYASLNFSYILEGYERQWNVIHGGNSVSYPNLPPGKFRFRLRVQNAEGDWMAGEQEFLFRIRPAWWQTALFKILLSLFGILLAVFVWRYLMERRLSKERLLFAEQEKKLSDALNKEKLDLFTNLSHELRTPLSLIYGPLKEILRTSMLSNDEKEKLSLMENNTRRLLDITEQIINFNNPADANKLKVTDSDVSSVLAGVVKNFDLAAKDSMQEISLDTPGSLRSFIDIDKFQKTVFNLISNAVRYTPVGGKISVRLSRLHGDHAVLMYPSLGGGDYDGDYIEVRVSDTGPGIQPDRVEQIFGRYIRLSGRQAVKPGDKGFGIGLNYVAYLVSLHRGSIKASNNEGGGACFSFVLPSGKEAYSDCVVLEGVAEASSFATAQVPQELPAARVDSAPEDPMSILVVEDDPQLRGYLSDILSSFGEVVQAGDGAEAMRILSLHVPDVIVSDIYMPLKDGFTLCAEVKESPQFCHTPVILLTALSTDENRMKGLLTNADAFVGKPFDPDFLRLTVRNVMTNRNLVRKSLINDMSGTEEGGGSALEKLHPMDRKFVEKLYSIIDANISDEDFNITVLGKELGMSRTSFYSKIKALFGDTPQNFLSSYRLEKAMALLKAGYMNVSEVAYGVGFGTLAGFSKSFKKHFGVSPSEVGR